jgi:hypothetical protein
MPSLLKSPITTARFAVISVRELKVGVCCPSKVDATRAISTEIFMAEYCRPSYEEQPVVEANQVAYAVSPAVLAVIYPVPPSAGINSVATRPVAADTP